MTEIWRDIRGYEGLYQVSDWGRVKSFWFGKVKILKPGRDGQGCLQVHLCKGNKQKTFYVHRLVAEAFLPTPQNLPEVDHIDTNKANCRAENLRWTTHSGNMRYAYETGARKSGEENPNAKLTNEQVIYIRENPDRLTQGQLAEKFDVGETAIRRAWRGETYKNTGGTIRGKIERRLPETLREEIRKLYATGEYSQSQIAAKFGAGQRTVCRIIHEK